MITGGMEHGRDFIPELGAFFKLCKAQRKDRAGNGMEPYNMPVSQGMSESRGMGRVPEDTACRRLRNIHRKQKHHRSKVVPDTERNSQDDFLCGSSQCMGYGIVEERAETEDNAHFVSMAEEQKKARVFYRIGTERDYWDNYPVLQMELPEQILNYLASQIEILDSNYGAERDVMGGMGGFCAVISKRDEAAEEAYQKILKEHYIQESMYEYLDTVTVDGTEWVEALYLTNNDYGIILIYQKGVEA